MSAETFIRPATEGDAREIAALFQISSEGVADYIWTKLAEPGETLLDVGARRYARENTAFSYQNCLMAERDGRVAGMLHAYPMVASEPGEEETDPVLRPAAELEAPGTLYISSLAVHEGYRGQGIGTLLLALAEERAIRRGQGGLSLISFEANEGAVRLYRRHGFEVIDQRTMGATSADPRGRRGLADGQTPCSGAGESGLTPPRTDPPARRNSPPPILPRGRVVFCGLGWRSYDIVSSSAAISRFTSSELL